MPKKADTATPKTPEEPTKVVAPATEPAKTDDAPVTPIVAARKIITVSHEDDEAPVAADAAPAEPATRVIKKTRIEPLTSTEQKPAATEPPNETKPAEAVASADAAKPKESAAKPADTQAAVKEESKDQPKEEPSEKPAEETEEAEVPPAESGFTLDEGDEGQHPLDEAQSEADKAAAAKQAELDKLVEAETYFLPINSVEKRRAKQFVLVTLLLVVVLGVAGAAWANSAGYITIPGL